MSRMRPYVWLAAAAAILAVTAPASAQYYQPFIEPGYFEPDFQFFAPAEVGEFGGREPPSTGVYFDYDRTYVSMSRPEGEPSLFSDTDSDFTWGNRYEIGYMLEEGTGWQLVHWHINGPSENFVHQQEALFADDGELDVDQVLPGPTALFSINVATMSSLELNKIWRRKEFHNGSVLELIAGYRHMTYKDFYRREEEIIEVEVVDDEFGLTYTRLIAQFENRMHGGQLGGRWFGQRGHWLLSADVRFFALANFQQLATTNEIVNFDENPVDDTLLEILGPDIERDRTYNHATQFVWGGEVRAEASYELTREINLRFGMVFFDLGQGIGRGNVFANNNQDVQVAGVTFGITINR